VVLKRAALSGLPAAATVQVAATASVADQSPFAVLTTDRVVLFTHTSSTNQWQFRRYDHASTAFIDSLTQLSGVAATVRDLHAAAAGSFVWVAFADGTGLQGLRFNAADATITAAASIGAGSPSEPFVLAVGPTEAMVFYDTGVDLRIASASGVTWTNTIIPGTDASDGQPAAVRDSDGTIYLFYTRLISGADNEIIIRRRSPISGEWSSPQSVPRDVASDQRPHPILIPGQGIWLVYMSNRNGTFDVFARQILTAI
jgi:streptogramin lyase